jgi:hypothetical protein
MLKITPGYKNFVQLFAKRQTDMSAQIGGSADNFFVQDMQSFNGRIAHFFQARAVNRNNTNTHNYETNIHNTYLPGQTV